MSGAEISAASFVLRPATQADSAAIRRLTYQVRNNPMGLAWPNFIVAVDGDRIIGCGQVKRHGDGSQELASIAVVPEMRGGGVARAIIERLLTQHTGRLYLTCRNELAPFYEKFGFRAAHAAELSPYFRRLQRMMGAMRRLRVIPSGGPQFMIR